MRDTKKLLFDHSLLPILLAIPFANFYIENNEEVLIVGSIWAIYFSVLLLFLIIQFFLNFCLKKIKISKYFTPEFIAYLVAITSFFLFENGHSFKGFVVRVVSFSALGFFIVKKEKVNTILKVGVCAMLATAIFQIIFIHLAGSSEEKNERGPKNGQLTFIKPSFQSKSTANNYLKSEKMTLKKKRNIYFIILDGYARKDILKNQYHFEDVLYPKAKQLGFFEAEKSYANFPLTMLSVSSTVNIAPIVQEGNNIDFYKNEKGTAGREGNDTFVNILKNAGYYYIHLNNLEWSTTICTREKHRCLNNVGFRLNETEYAFLRMSPFPRVFARFLYATYKKYKEIRKIESVPQTNLSFLNKNIDSLFNRPGVKGRPHYLFAHMFNPHPPFHYDKECKYSVDVDGSYEDWGPKYLNELKCAGKEAIELIENIQKRDPEGIIVIQSDHGPSRRKQFHKYFRDWTRDDFQERYGILNIIKMDKECEKEYLHKSITPINTLRAVLNCVMKEKLPTDPTKSLFSNYKKLPDYGLIKAFPKEFY